MKSTIKYMFVAVISMIGILIFSFFYFIGKGASIVSSNLKEVEELIGEKVILEGDTLMVLDYSVTNQTYTLDNGKEITISLGKKLETVEK